MSHLSPVFASDLSRDLPCSKNVFLWFVIGFSIVAFHSAGVYCYCCIYWFLFCGFFGPGVLNFPLNCTRLWYRSKRLGHLEEAILSCRWILRGIARALWFQRPPPPPPLLFLLTLISFYACTGTDSLPALTHTHTHTLINLVKGEECREESSGNTRVTLPPSVRALILPPKAPLFRGTLDIEGFRLVVSRGRANAHRAETAPSWGIIIVGQAVLLTAVNGDAVCNWGGLIGFCLYVGSR